MTKQDNDNGLLLVGTGYVRNRRILGSMKEQIGNLISLKLTSRKRRQRIGQRNHQRCNRNCVRFGHVQQIDFGDGFVG